eukprot:m51a1_g4653 putative lysosomal alpha-mannosidase (909) ;mRNA; f:21586-25008
MRTALALAALAATAALAALPPPPPVYAPDAPLPPYTLNVHAVAHTHDDPGWLQTVEGYYTSAVRRIITNVVKGLAADPARKFTYVEMAFFTMWWDEQDDSTRQLVRTLVDQHRLEFTIGGWCMPDEAAPTYTDLIDQMSAGHLWLLKTFGDSARPRAGWQIDPFGHSRGSAWLFDRFGFNSTVVNRIDRHDLEWRRAHGALNFLWQPSRTHPADRIPTTVLYSHYNWPAGRSSYGGRVSYSPREFAQQMYAIRTAFATPEILVTFGDDFQWGDAEAEFRGLDELIAHFAAHPEARINLFYSTPAAYGDAVAARGLQQLGAKTDDFWPYGDSPDDYWSGYFTSHPAFKRSVRASSALFHAARAALVASAGGAVGEADLRALEAPWRAVGVAQHHDAITGTSKSFVYDDYLKRLAAGDGASASLLLRSLAGPQSAQWALCSARSADAESEYSCSDVLKPGETLAVFNPLGRTRDAVVSLSVAVADVCVTAANGTKVDSQLLKTSEGLRLVFAARALGPLAAATFGLAACERSPEAPQDATSGVVRIENELVAATFEDGALAEVLDKTTGTATRVAAEVLYYVPEGSPYSPRSGAYVFAADKPAQPFAGARTATRVAGTLSEEVEVRSGGGVVQRYTVYAGEPFVRVATSVGPIDVSDRNGKEVVVRYSAPAVRSAGALHTDAHGLEYVEHQRDVIAGQFAIDDNRISGNFYPASLSAYVADAERALGLAMDRAQGVASLRNGSLEAMVHRRLLDDGDHKGVGEALDDQTAIRTEHILVVAPASRAARSLRAASLLQEHPVVVAHSASASHVAAEGPAMAELPASVHATTLQPHEGGQTIVRLTHMYAAGEDAELSREASVDLGRLLSGWRVAGARETTLSGNAVVAESLASLVVTLQPMQTRTFVVTLAK